MKLNPLLPEAVEIFKTLGWDNAERADAAKLPLGTPEQQRLVVKGLESGDWGEFGLVGENSYGWIAAHEVNNQMLALFAVRCGVSARRAEQLVTGDDEVAFDCITQRGVEYASQFLDHYYRSTIRMHEHTLSVLGALGVSLALFTNRAPLANLDYLKDWAVLARHALTGNTRDMYREYSKLPELTEITPSFKEHVDTAIEVGVPVTGPFGELLSNAFDQNVLTRNDILEACVKGMDLAVRPGDRKVFSQLLTAGLRISETELITHREVFKNLMSTGEAPVVEGFAPQLISLLDPVEAAEVALTALYAKTSKSRLQVLKALVQRNDLSAADALLLADRVSEIASSKDKPAARLAKKLLANWNLDLSASVETEPIVKGLWQPTPPLWEVPKFELGEVSITALAHAINHLRTDDQYLFDIEGDRLLALAVELAKTDIEQVRSAFSGVKRQFWSPLVFQWLENNEVKLFGDDYLSHSQMVFANLGMIPCLLSTPSRLDSSVTFIDLAERLNLYALAKQEVLETDLVLSLLRLNLGEFTDATKLPSLPSGVPVKLMDGSVLERDAAQVIRDYLADPLQEGRIDDNLAWLIEPLEMPQSLRGLQLPFRLNYMARETTRLFPHWGAFAFIGLRWIGAELTYAGICADDASYRAKPLPAEAAINLLALQRPVHPKMAELCAEGLENAWKRGLLVPGVADVAYLDWGGQLSNLASLAKALQEVAEQGMLSVVWPVLDDLLVASLKLPRLPAGIAEVAEVMASVVTEVLVAVEQGVADKSVLEVPGVRALAARNGKSKAVEAAKAVVAQLPEVSQPVNVVENQAELEPGEFEKTWQPIMGLGLLPEDGAKILGFDEKTAISTCALPVIFTLPAYPGERFISASNNWYYAITHEHQAQMLRISQTGSQQRGYVHWDGTQLVFSEYRNWKDQNNSGLEGEPSVWSQFLAKIILADLATHPDPYGPRNIVSEMVKEGIVDNSTVAVAVNELLPYSQWSPARAVYLLESQPELLVELWPLLTETLSYAAKQTTLPRWTNRVLDITLLHARVLYEATSCGYIPIRAWDGAAKISQRKGSSVAIEKARSLTLLLKLA